MTEIERKALEILNDVRGDNLKSIGEHGWYTTQAALLRAIEQHEAFRQEVSDAVEHCRRCSDPEAWTRIKFELARFIIAKPDPLVEAMSEWQSDPVRDDDYTRLREALAKRGLEIREKNE